MVCCVVGPRPPETLLDQVELVPRCGDAAMRVFGAAVTGARLLGAEEPLEQRFALEPEVGADLVEDRRQRAHSECCVVGDRQVMLAGFLGGEAQVTARLPCDRVAEPPERVCELAAGEIAREPHRSSRLTPR